ncbi:hypothetical protein IFM89_004767 [Coptis chinensis]|uniref:Uncharacterized protein n=1 Tax=Coptis chinensis TaxID=261450 RepID=A0A835HGF2_9MAGN|nr:hypothetical protein IFM89_004767 [Coptis chinensis]
MADDEVRNLLIHYGGFFKTPRRRLERFIVGCQHGRGRRAYIVGVYDMTEAIPEVEVEDPTVEALNTKGKERKGGRKVKGKGVIVDEDDPFWSNVGTFDVNTYNVMSEDELVDDEEYYNYEGEIVDVYRTEANDVRPHIVEDEWERDHKNRMADAVWVATVMLEHMKAEEWDINGLVPAVVKKIEKMIEDIPNWDLEAIVILYKMRADWREYCSSYFWVSTYRMAYKGHIKPMEDPRDRPSPTPDEPIPSTSTHPFRPRKNRRREMKMRKHQTRREGSVASPSQPSTRSKSRVASSSQPPLASPSSQPSQVPSTRSKSKVALESQPPPGFTFITTKSSTQRLEAKSKVATLKSQPPTSPSQPSTRRKSICACSNQVPTSPSSHPKD